MVRIVDSWQGDKSLRRRIGLHIVTNFHKLICVDLCRLVDRGFLTGFMGLTGLMEVFVTIKALFALIMKA